MPRIYYTAYKFNPPGGPLSKPDYEKIRGMNAQDFKEYLDALASSSWPRFWAEQRSLCMIVFIGLPGNLLLYWALDINKLGGIFIITALISFLAGIGLLMSFDHFSSYVKSMNSYMSKHRESILLSNTYEEYLERDGRLLSKV